MVWRMSWSPFMLKEWEFRTLKNKSKKCMILIFLLRQFSRITNAIFSEVVAWQNRPIDDLYLIFWMDGIVFKVRENSKVINKTIYLAVGLNRERRKEVLGMRLGENESSSFWMSLLTDLKYVEWKISSLQLLIIWTDLPKQFALFSLTNPIWDFGLSFMNIMVNKDCVV